MLPKYYEFQNTVKIISGQYSLENIAHELKERGSYRPMVLSNSQLLELGIVDLVLAGLRETSVQVGYIYDNIPADSSVVVVNEAAKIFREKNCDSMIAIGGGSVIDTAKGLSIVINQKAEDIIDYMGCEILEGKESIPFIAVPTTSGTGSEVTMVAVIANPARGIKMEFISPKLLPHVAILDPRMTATLPPRITASTGMDALTHAIEAYTCSQKNPLSDAYAVAAIKLIVEYLPKAVVDGKDIDARLALANASLMAGVAFSNSMVGLVHAIGHAAGGVTHVPHGDAMSILMPYCMEYNMDVLHSLYAELLLYLAGPDIYVSTIKDQRARKSVEIVREMLKFLQQKCGYPMTLSAANIKEENLHEIAKKALNDGAIIANPKDADYEDILKILHNAY